MCSTHTATYAVFGLGKAGKAAVDFLLKQGATVYAWDDAQKNERSESLAIYSSPESWPWDAIEALVLSPGIPLTHPKPHNVVELAHRANVPIIGDVELLYRHAPDATYIGITGTNGKSTTTALIGHIAEQLGLECAVGGNLGTPAIALPLLGKGGIYVLELSSYQLDLMHETHINIAVLLNMTPDHIDRHGSMQGYINAKRRIFRHQGVEDTAIIGVDDTTMQDLHQGLSSSSDARIVPISGYRHMTEGVSMNAGRLYDCMVSHCDTYRLPPLPYLPGQHNQQNTAAAYAAIRALGIEGEAIVPHIASFKGLSHRLQLVREINGIRYVNDSKATNADATSHALAAFESIYWIVGGRPKEGGIVSLEPYFRKIRHAFVIGEKGRAGFRF